MALQGNNVTIFKLQDKVEAAKKALCVGTTREDRENFKAFDNLSEIQKEYNIVTLPQDIITQI